MNYFRLMAEEHTNLVPILQIYGHTLPITGISMGQLSTCLYSCSKDGMVKCWDLFNGGEISSLSLPSPVNSILMVTLNFL